MLPDSKANPYSIQKLIHHPKALQMLRERKPQYPTQIHFMPALSCNQHCSFCSYGHRLPGDGPEQKGWKNMQMMSEAFLPREKMMELISDWKVMRVKAIELTGGGEPLIWPHVDEFLERMAGWGADLALVTNGTALTKDRAEVFSRCNWKWVRVSIDAGSREGYTKTRRVPANHWDLAWKAVERFVAMKTQPDQRVGVGYVVDWTNWGEVWNACHMAAQAGADNIRISLAFTPQHMERFPEDIVDLVGQQVEMARHDFKASRLQIIDLVGERARNIEAQTQDYSFCAIKEVLCVVGGDQKVYSCCTLAFNEKGLVGSIKDQSFRDLWEEASASAFPLHDASRICTVPCLYEKRNKRALEILDLPVGELPALQVVTSDLHKNFI